MYFKKLEIFGFKSFADKTVLKFEPGMTAIVGPNGCGKSNVFDAIRWVLGEQSSKQLRGSSMEDVIFNGTANKAPLSLAEVSVTFDNQSKVLPIEYNEVTITRRLFRSGESEYLINKSRVRLKDIQEMFMGTGVGAEAYSLVQQGKVDLVVSAKPEERRQIFDEASGITKYKSKKREALNKLKLTDANLLRINDIVVEVKRQIVSIERQAKKAQRFKDEFEKLKQLEMIFAAHQMQELEAQKKEVEDFLNNIQNQDEDSSQEIEELRAIISRNSHTLEEVEERLSSLREGQLRVDNEIELSHRQIGFNQERIEGLANNASRLGEQKQQLVEKTKQEQERIAQLRSGLNALSDTMQQAVDGLNQKKAELQKLLDVFEESRKAIEDDERKMLALTSKQVHLKNGFTEIMKDIQNCLGKKRRLEAEQAKVAQDKEDVLAKEQSTLTQKAELNAEIEQKREEQMREQQELSRREKNVEEIDEQVAHAEKKRVFLISQKDFIEKMHVQYQDIPDPVIDARILTSIPPKEKQGGIIGKIKEVNSSSQGYEITCEAKFVDLNPEDIQQDIQGIDQQINQFSNQRNEQKLQLDHQKALVEEVTQALHDQEKQLSILTAQLSDIKDTLAKIGREQEAIDIEMKNTDDDLVSLKEREQQIGQQLDDIEQDYQACQNNIKSAQNKLADLTLQREEFSVAIAQLETEVSSLADKEKHQQENLSHFTSSLEVGLNEIKRLEAQDTEQTDQKAEYLKAIEDLQNNITQAKEHKEQGAVELEEVGQERNDIATRLNAARQNIQDIEGSVQANKDKVHQYQLRQQEINFNEQALKERLLQAYKLDIDEILKAPEPETNLLEQAEQGEQAQEQPTQPELNVDEMATEISRLKKRCDSFGSVNLAAMDEFEELKERFEFLTKQQSDLLEAKDALHKTINKINRTTKQLFMDSFIKVNEQFRIYFKALFGGGDAELVLLDPENPLESGIDIVARPPGKKLQNISLMSGGEKTLTAIGLIFGVFKVNPSPFCVLDEIDAALDDANVERFATMLKEFTKIAQFIVITHNKNTMNKADVMYGVTMQKTGISRLVSVKLSEAEAMTAESEEQAPALIG